MAGRRSRLEKARTRQRLLDSAAAVFIGRGFHGATLAEIARRSGLTTGAIYASFAGKDELFLAVFEEDIALRVREIDEALASGTHADRKAAPAARQWMEKVEAEPRWFPLVAEFWAHAVRRPGLRERFAVPFGALRVALGRHLASGPGGNADGSSLSPEELGTIVKALGNGLALEKLADPEGVSNRLFGRALEIFLAGLEAGESANQAALWDGADRPQ
jgi:AcrR family transcriptional regulator